MPEDEEKEIRRRAFWSGTITFGLVSVPVALFPGIRSERVSLRMTAPDGTPLRRRYFCPKEERLIEKEEIVRGYEIERDRFVVVTDEELEALEPKKSREIDLRRFVPVGQIDPMVCDRAYFFVPTGDSLKPYRLLARAMEKTGRAGVATFVMRGKEYLVAILSENGILRAETLRFFDEVRSPEEVGLSKPARDSTAGLDELRGEIQSATAETMDPREMEDEGSRQLLELVARKQKEGERVVHPPGEIPEREEGGGKVIDLMELIKRSIDTTESRGRRGRGG